MRDTDDGYCKNLFKHGPNPGLFLFQFCSFLKSMNLHKLKKRSVAVVVSQNSNHRMVGADASIGDISESINIDLTDQSALF